MRLDVSFDDAKQNTGVSFSEHTQEMPGNIGNYVVVHDGMNGATFYPSVSEDGVISWTNDRELENPAPVNIKGAKGDKGDKGDQGERGLQGVQGIQGEKGEKGDTGVKGDKGDPGKDGVNGADGKDGSNGKDGADGYTPVKGTDYFTASDKAEMVQAVISALPIYDGSVTSV